MDNGWIGISDRPIAAGDQPVIVWHVYQGAMVCRREDVASNRFYSHWREIDTGAWIDTAERRPTRNDADAQECVISQNKWDEISVAGWHRFENESSLIRWQHPPEPPANFRELREKAE